MKKIAGVLFAVVLTVFATSNRAEAGSITFVLDCTVTSMTACGAPTGTFGSVTLTDSANPLNVDVSVLLLSGTIQVLSLNLTPTLSGTFTASGGNIGLNSINYVIDASGAFSRFDLKIEDTSTPYGPNPLTFTLSNNLNNLDVANFFVKDDVAQLYAAVRVGDTETVYGATRVVPEPASLSLLGLGLSGLAAAVRRRKARR